MQRNVFRVTAVLSFLLNEEEVLRLLEEASAITQNRPMSIT